MPTPTITAARLCLIALLGSAGLALPACRGERTDKPPRQFLPDMDDSPKFKPQTKTDFFVDGRAMRPAVLGTVAFGENTDATDKGRAHFLKEDKAYFTGKTGEDKAEQYVEKIPAMAVDAFMTAGITDRAAAAQAMLDRGQERFKIYCSICHGYDGKGKGMVGQAWSYDLGTFNFHDDQYQRDGAAKKDPQNFKWRDGFLFYTIRNGVADTGTQVLKMPSYGHALNERDAWAVVAYIRSLQATYTGIDVNSPEINDDTRQQLLRTKPAPTPAPAAKPADKSGDAK